MSKTIRWPSHSWWAAGVLTLLCAIGAPPAWSVDLDQNGLDDSIERELVEKFKPAVMLHSLRIVEPEPIEIMAREPTSALDVFDLDYFRIDVRGRLICRGPFCYCQSSSSVCQGTAGLHTLSTVGTSGVEVYAGYVDYGGNGNENAGAWEQIYLYGNSHVLPGDQYPPKIYAHVFEHSPDGWIVQYWFFYPYNDGWNDHEGDWEHINVLITSTDPATAQVRLVDYYAHEIVSHVDQPQKLYYIDETHPVVFVGGSTSAIGGDGDTSGASWPSPGNFSFGWDTERVYLGGKFLHPSNIEAEIIPNTTRIGESGGTNMSAWFDAHPEKQWMRCKFRTGYISSDSPLGIANDSPMNVTYKATWYSREPDGTSSYDGFWDNLNNKPAIAMVVAKLEGKSTQVPVHVELPGIDWDTTTPYYQRVIPEDDWIRFTVPEIYIDGDQGVYRFRQWSDGTQSPTTTIANLDSQSHQLYSVDAVYEQICQDSIELDGVYVMDGMERYYSSGGITTDVFVVQAGAGAELVADTEMLLRPGTGFVAGSEVEARIADVCSQYGAKKADDVVALLDRPRATAAVAKAEPVEEKSGPIPARFYATDNFPNPFNAQTSLEFGLAEATRVSLRIYDLRGTRVATLVDGVRQAGIHRIEWDGRDSSGRAVASGVYYYSLHANEEEVYGKMVLLK